MEQNYYWKSTSRSASHKILHLLLNPTVWTRGCVTTFPPSVFCTSSSTQLFSVSKILALRERKFDHVITISYTCQVETQDFHRYFQKCPVAGLGDSSHMRRGRMENWLYLLRVKYKSSDISIPLQSLGPIFTNLFIKHIYTFFLLISKKADCFLTHSCKLLSMKTLTLMWPSLSTPKQQSMIVWRNILTWKYPSNNITSQLPYFLGSSSSTAISSHCTQTP